MNMNMNMNASSSKSTKNASTSNSDQPKNEKFKGVRYRSEYRKWAAEIGHENKKIWLGTFHTAEEASKAYQTKKAEIDKEVEAKRLEQIDQELPPEEAELAKEYLLKTGKLDPVTKKKINPPKKRKSSEKDSVITSEGSENMVKRKKKEFPGVNVNSSGKFITGITHPITKEKLDLGIFDTPQEAHEAYLAKRMEFKNIKRKLENQEKGDGNKKVEGKKKRGPKEKPNGLDMLLQVMEQEAHKKRGADEGTSSQGSRTE